MQSRKPAAGPGLLHLSSQQLSQDLHLHPHTRLARPGEATGLLTGELHVRRALEQLSLQHLLHEMGGMTCPCSNACIRMSWMGIGSLGRGSTCPSAGLPWSSSPSERLTLPRRLSR
jgi:hypothetical protein